MTLRSTLLLFILLIISNNKILAADATLILSADMPNISDPVAGKYAQLASLVEQQRAQQDNVFFFYGGGSIGPSALATFDKGSHIIDILNSIEPDAMGVTKREFSFFEDELSLRAYEAAFPLLASNIVDARTQRNINEISSSLLVQKNSFKLGIVSILHERVIAEYLLKNVDVKPPLDALKQHIRQLRKQGADAILVHYSYPFSFIPELLEQKQIDIAFLSNARLADQGGENTITHPNIVELKQAGSAAIVKLSLATEQTSIQIESINLSALQPSQGIQQQLNSYENRLNRLLDVNIGVWQSDFTTRRNSVRSEENRFANFITDAMLAYSDADIALINGGSIRGNADYNSGTPISRRSIVTELPFLSKLSLITLSGKDIIDAIEHGLSQIESYKGRFLHVAGLKIVANTDNPVGSRVITIMHNGSSIKPEQRYQVATTDFLAAGGDDFTMLNNANSQETEDLSAAPLISELVTRSIVRSGKAQLNTDNRFVNEAK